MSRWARSPQVVVGQGQRSPHDRIGGNDERPVEDGSFLFVTQYFPPERGAAPVRIGAVTQELARLGHRVEVVTAIPNYPTGRLFPGWPSRPVQATDEEGVRVIRVWLWAAVGSGAGRVANYLTFAAMSVLGLVQARPASWTVVEYPTLFGALPAVLWARARRRRVVVNVADLWVDATVAVGVLRAGPLVSGLLALERTMLRRVDAVNAVTEGVRDALVAKGVDPARICWLPNGVDTELFHPGAADPVERAALAELGVTDRDRLVVYAGTHGYVHGLEVVLDAAEDLAGEHVCFLLVGGGSERDALVAEARRRGLANVVFHEPVTPERVASMLRCAVAGLASVRDGDLYRSIRSAKMLPVMATGLPVVYAGDDEGGALVARVGAGLQVPPGDGAALAAAVRAVIADPASSGAMGERGRAHVEAEAGWSAIVARWLGDLGRVDVTASRRR